MGLLERIREFRATLRGSQAPGDGESYTAQVLRIRQDHAAGIGAANDGASLAVVGACASTWAAALSACAVTGPPAITPSVLEWIGFDLIRRGQSVWRIGVAGGEATLDRPHGAQRINRGWTLTYNDAPDESYIERALPSQVANIRWEPSPLDGWTGIPPWTGVTAQLAGELDAHHRDIAKGPGGYLLGMVSGANQGAPGRAGQALDEAEGRGPELSGKRRGGLSILSIPEGFDARGQSGSIAPGKIAHDIGEGSHSVMRRLTAELAGACGVPLALVDGTGGAAAIREGQRVFANRLQMRADRIAADLSEALGADVAIDASAIFKTDVTMRARAFRALVGTETQPGLSVEEARRVVGI